MTKLDSSRMVTLPLGVIDTIDHIILALDPGGTTGYAYYNPWTGQVTCGQLSGPHHLELLGLIERLLALSVDYGGYKLTVVYERFEFRQSEEAVRAALLGFIDELCGGRITKLAMVISRLRSIAKIRPSRDRLVLDSKEYIGVIKLAVQQHEGVIPASHSASEGKSFVKDNKLTALGWYKLTAAMPHARDALRHLLRHMEVALNVGAPITTAWLNGSR